MNQLITVCSASFIIFLLASSPSIDAAIYKWKDDKGQIHYTAIAPEGIEKANIEADIVRFSQTTATPSTSTNQSDNTNPDDTTKQENTDGTTNNGYCEQQKNIVQTLENNDYIKWKEGDKETLLEGEKKAAQVAKIKQEMEKFCSKEPAPQSN